MTTVELIESEIEIATNQIEEATRGLSMEMRKGLGQISECYVKEKSEAIAKHTQKLAHWKNKQG